jgi:hypothetical protein
MESQYFDDFLESCNLAIFSCPADYEQVPQEYVEVGGTINFHVVELKNAESCISEKFFVALPTGQQHWDALMKNNPQHYMCGVLSNLMNQASRHFVDGGYSESLCEKQSYERQAALSKKDYDRLTNLFKEDFSHFLHELYLTGDNSPVLLCLALCRFPDTNKETLLMMFEDDSKWLGDINISELAANHPKLKDILVFS